MKYTVTQCYTDGSPFFKETTKYFNNDTAKLKSIIDEYTLDIKGGYIYLGVKANDVFAELDINYNVSEYAIIYVCDGYETILDD